MKITYIKNDKEHTFESSKTLSWFEIYKAIEKSPSEAPHIVTLAEAIKLIKKYISESEGKESYKYWQQELRALWDFRDDFENVNTNNIYLISTYGGDYSNRKAIGANNQEEACKEYLLNYAECKIIKIEEAV